MGNLTQRIGSWIKFVKLYRNWVQGMFLWRKISGKVRILRLRDGSKFLVRPGIPDIQMINETYLDKPYHPGLKNLRQNPVIVDIGANIGDFVVLAGKKLGRSRIYAYEPSPENFRILKKNIKLNRLQDQARLFELAVAKRSGKGKLFFGREGAATHSLQYKSSAAMSVKTISLPEIFKQNKLDFCDFLKMDCEGGEYEIFYNTPQKIFDKIGRIIMEYHSNGDPYKLKEFFERKGFKVRLTESNLKGFGFINATR